MRPEVVLELLGLRHVGGSCCHLLLRRLTSRNSLALIQILLVDPIRTLAVESLLLGRLLQRCLELLTDSKTFLLGYNPKNCFNRTVPKHCFKRAAHRYTQHTYKRSLA